MNKNIFSKKNNNNFFFKTKYIILLILLILFINYFEFNLITNFKEKIIGYFSNIIYYSVEYTNKIIFNLKKKINSNNDIIEENRKLKEEVILYKSKQLILNNYIEENIKLKKLLKIKILNKYNYIVAKTIYYNYILSTLVINKGKNSNISIGQPVINDLGVVGQVISVNDNTSIILLISSRKHKIPVKIFRNGIRFIINGYGIYEKLYLNEFSTLFNEDIEEGDLLLSSGLGDKFPENYPVGVVTKLKKNNNKLYIDIIAETSFKMKDIDYLIIIKND